MIILLKFCHTNHYLNRFNDNLKTILYLMRNCCLQKMAGFRSLSLAKAPINNEWHSLMFPDDSWACIFTVGINDNCLKFIFKKFLYVNAFRLSNLTQSKYYQTRPKYILECLNFIRAVINNITYTLKKYFFNSNEGFRWYLRYKGSIKGF